MSRASQADAPAPKPRRGDIWRVNLEPTLEREIQSSKGSTTDTRPVLVLTRPGMGEPGVSLCAPLCNYDAARDVARLWRVVLLDTPESGLTKLCCADVSQTRALDISRFVRKDGRAHANELDATAKALALTVEATGFLPSTETEPEI